MWALALAACMRQRFKTADRSAHVARLAGKGEEFARAIRESGVDWIYVRFVPSTAEVKQAHGAGKKVFLSGPRVAGQEDANWRAAAEAGVDAILTDYPLELREALRGNRRD